MNIPFDIVGRSSSPTYRDIQISQYDLVVNCTPVGMLGFGTKSLDLPFHEIAAGTYFIDLVYNPARTPMMESFARNGAIIMNGEKMLHAQADKAWEVFYKAFSAA